MKKLLPVSLISIGILFSGCNSSTQPTQNNQNNTQIKQEAKNAIMMVGGALKKNLIGKMKEGGPEVAAKFCSISASDVAKKASHNLPEGISVKRITNKPRNISNKANEKQAHILNMLEKKHKEGNMPKMYVEKASNGAYEVYKPIVVGSKCLLCHGDNKVRNKKAYEVISKKYKDDKAINYKQGDFRGAFLVEIIK